MGELIKAEFEVLDDRFERVAGDRFVEVVHTGCRWVEGPAYFPAGRYLVFSDIPNDRILRWDETTGVVGLFRSPSGFSNGHTVDRQGRLISCEHGNRRVTRTEHDGSITVLADRYQGRRLNSPNDVVERADGSVWFTDPSFGIDSDYEGHRADSEIGGCHVYRIGPSSGAVRKVADDLLRPNGLAFTADERRLYIVDTFRRHVRLFDVDERGGLTGGAVFGSCTTGSFDGLRVDSDGRVWVAGHEGLHCFHQDGTLLGKLRLPEVVSNLTFGGAQRNHVFITATSSVYAIRLGATGVRYPR
jgi:gluconolactonase